MWFKNLKIYHSNNGFTLDESQLQMQLESLMFKKCQSQEQESVGWVPLLHQSEQLFHNTQNVYLLCLKREQKLLPASVVKEELNQRISNIESETGLPVNKKQQKELKEQIETQLLPQAFSKYSHIYGMVFLNQNVVVVDSSSDANAELFLSSLRKCIQSLPVVPLCKTPQQHALTLWLTASAPETFEILDEAELKSSSDEGGSVKLKKFDLYCDEVKSHIDNGMLVESINVDFSEQLQCVIHSDLSIKRLKFSDAMIEQSKENNDDKQYELDAIFYISQQVIIDLVKSLNATFDLDLAL